MPYLLEERYEGVEVEEEEEEDGANLDPIELIVPLVLVLLLDEEEPNRLGPNELEVPVEPEVLDSYLLAPSSEEPVVLMVLDPYLLLLPGTLDVALVFNALVPYLLPVPVELEVPELLYRECPKEGIVPEEDLLRPDSLLMLGEDNLVYL